MPASSFAPAVALVFDASSAADPSLTRELGRHVVDKGWATTWIVSDVDQIALVPAVGSAATCIGVRSCAGDVGKLCAAVDRLRLAGCEVETILSVEPITARVSAQLAVLGVRGVVSEAASTSDVRPIGSGIWQAAVNMSVPGAGGIARWLKKSPQQSLEGHRSGLVVVGVDLQSARVSSRARRELTRLMHWLGAAPSDRFAFQSISDAIAVRDARAVGRPQRSILRAA
ncbi:hypothetical protein OAS39_12450 [Pirellulales bacterium]|nr:hypothetical protein [Pirellulales bacterium]